MITRIYAALAVEGLTPRPLILATVLCFYKPRITFGDQLLKVKYTFNLETLIYVGDLNVTNHIHFQLCIAVG